MKPSKFALFLCWFFRGLNDRFIAWHRLPKFLGILNLLAFRIEQRHKNLHDTYPHQLSQGSPADTPMTDPRFLTARHSDGLFNDLEQPKMGCVGMRFGRNFPRDHTKSPSEEELMNPNPRVISEKLMARKEFKPATSLNLLAAAWIQFQVHDWVGHYESETEMHDIPLPAGDTWSEPRMRVFKTEADVPIAEMDKTHQTHRNKNTHWWDGSQIYGSTEEETTVLRGGDPDGKLLLIGGGAHDFLPRDSRGLAVTGFHDNWWTGLELLHTLFVLEHNAICMAIRKENPDWTGDRVFDTARLVNTALMAKIHTIEWTPGILGSPLLKMAMNANWWGLLGETLHKKLGKLTKNETLSGIPGSGVHHHGTPYTLTDEFVAVYRLHPLLPDGIDFLQTSTGKKLVSLPMKEVIFEKSRQPMEHGATFTDLFYSFGVANPGAITIHNFPNWLRDITTPDGKHLDLAAVDILRDRERGIPRYNQFRRLFHMPPAKNFEDMTGGDAKLAGEVSEIYGGDIEKVDLLIGTLCEPVPKGFGFSDTAFRVFILMASRRLKSDRFIAGKGWSVEYYTKTGMDWVQNSTMSDVLLRHFPELAPALKGVKNAFAPWNRAA